MGKFVVKKTNTGYTWSLKAGNGEFICIVGEVKTAVQALQKTHLRQTSRIRPQKDLKLPSALNSRSTPIKRVRQDSA